MKNKNDNYALEIMFLPILIVIFLVISITSYNIHLTKTQLIQQVEAKKQEYFDTQKKIIYDKVQFINYLIKTENHNVSESIKKELNDRIKNAIVILNSVYNDSKIKSKEDKISEVIKRLSVMKYNEGRGYYYVLDKNDLVLEHPKKEVLGKNFMNIFNKQGNSIGEILKGSIKEKEIGFSQYYYYKPNNKEEQFLKISAFTHFKPLDIYIGTGEYIDSAQDEVKIDFIERLTNIETLDKYIFILDIHDINGGEEFATMLLNNNRKDLIGKKVSDRVRDSKNKLYRKEYLDTARENGDGFVTYWYKKPGVEEPKEKQTYVLYNNEWNWLIASGFYLDDLEESIKQLEKESAQRLDDILNNSFFWGLIFSIISIVVSYFVYRRVQGRIDTSREKILLIQENLKQAQSVSKIGSWSYNLKTRDIIVSDEVYKILDIKKVKKKLKYDDFLQRLYKEDIKQININFNKAIKDKEPFSFSQKIKLKNQEKLISNKCEIFSTNKDEIMVGTIQDVTEEYEKDKRIEEQSQMIYHQSKMAAMGEMIENIAHQWRQPLSAILSSVTGAKLRNDYNELSKDELAKSFEDIINNTKYLSNTIEDFRTYFIQDKEYKECNIKDVYLDTAKLVRSKFRAQGIELVEEFDNLSCSTLENELVQCLINILNNAYDVLIKTKLEHKLIFVKIYKEYDNVVITIKDNAGGIENNIIQKVFEPYFTTKHKSQGTGIGLYMTQEIITKHLNGYIKVYNEEFEYNKQNYKGACFKIVIPINS